MFPLEQSVIASSLLRFPLLGERGRVRADSLLILLIGFFLVSPPARANDWPCWRGPDHNGISTEKAWSSSWPGDGPKHLWKASVGTGFSSVSVVKGRLFT